MAGPEENLSRREGSVKMKREELTGLIEANKMRPIVLLTCKDMHLTLTSNIELFLYLNNTHVTFSHRCGKMTDKKQLEEGSVDSLRGYSPPW